jgi:uncharacterized delta-60 repeat protein
LVLAGVASAQDGALDPSFSGDGKMRVYFDAGGDLYDAAFGMAIQPDGKIVVAGRAAVSDTDTDSAVARILPNGNLDSTFSGDGKVLVHGGSHTDVFAAVGLQADGKIVAGGGKSYGGTDTDFMAARLWPDGSLDVGFGTSGIRTVAFDLGGGDTDYMQDMAIHSDGSIVMVGQVKTAASDYDIGIVKLNSDGTMDLNFSGDGKKTLTYDYGGSKTDVGNAVAIQPDGKILIGATITVAPLETDWAVIRMHPNGSLDTSFGGNGGVEIAFDLMGPGQGSDSVTDILVQPDGKIVVVGNVTSEYGDWDMGVARLNADGSLDTTFSSDGKKTVWYDLGGDNMDVANAAAITADNRVLLAGWATVNPPLDLDVAVVRLTASGALDSTFGNNGKTLIPFNYGGNLADVGSAACVQDDGKVVVAGRADAGGTGGDDSDFAVLRLLSSTSGEIFSDGFETNDLSRWSVVFP